MFSFLKNKEDKELRELISKSYKSLQVVGRGTIKIDPKEVSDSQAFKEARKLAAALITHKN